MTIHPTDCYACPECGSRAVHLDASVDACYDPNTGKGWTPNDEVICDNLNGFIQCRECGTADDHGSRWLTRYRYFRHDCEGFTDDSPGEEITRARLVEVLENAVLDVELAIRDLESSAGNLRHLTPFAFYRAYKLRKTDS